MSVMDKLINAMKFNDDMYEDENEGEERDIYESAPENEEQVFEREEDSMEDIENTSVPRSTRRRNVPEREGAPSVRPPKRQYSGEASMEVCIAKPTSVNDARDVTDLILSGSSVVLNLEGLDVEVAQRILDFISGSSYAVQGNIMKISHYIFVITPSTVDISGDISTPVSPDQDGGASLDMPYSGR